MYKIIILFAALILTSTIYAIGVSNDAKDKIDCLNDIQNQVQDIKSDFESMYQELEKYKNELANIGCDDDIASIYDKILDINNKINDLYDTIESHTEGSSMDNEKSEEKIEEPIVTEDTEEQNGSYSDGIYSDMYDRYYGRLYIPELNINVALYYGYEQYITDRYDSASIYIFKKDGYTIADHNNQEFSKLLNVKVGTKAYIHKKYSYDWLECVNVFYGYNTGYDIVDENYASVFDKEDYMIYTCTSGSKKILISLWKITRMQPLDVE